MEENENTINSEKRLYKTIRSYISLPSLIGIIIGSVGGYIYYMKIGCVSGTCPITSNPWLTTLWGAAVGYLIGDMFKRKKQ
ncbi:DUF6132 family protein [Bacteroidota bacterium]